MRIIGHKTASMYRRYRIVDERDLKEATQSLNAYLATQPTATVVAPMKRRPLASEDTDNARTT
jgi:hypothetical protein